MQFLKKCLSKLAETLNIVSSMQECRSPFSSLLAVIALK